MRFPRAFVLMTPAALAVVLAVPAAASGASTGGASADEGPSVSGVRCVPSPQFPCAAPQAAQPGGALRIRGRDLSAVKSVVFRGGPGRRDDVVVRAEHVRATHLDATVPVAAKTGRLEVRARRGQRALTPAPVRVEAGPAPAAAAPGTFVFPIRGKHDLGQSDTNNFGGGRDHKGQDMFAKCGTPLVVAEGGTVRVAEFEGRAGNFAVITGAQTGRDYVYMHMQEAALVAKGQQVGAGQPLGKVGDSGNASGCHVHFELWSAPGWYAGGAPGDPLPDVTAWDRQDPAHKHR